MSITKEAQIRELKKGAITRSCNQTASGIRELLDYAAKAGKHYTELHLSAGQWEAVTKDKLRALYALPHNDAFQHREDGCYFSGGGPTPSEPGSRHGRVSEYQGGCPI